MAVPVEPVEADPDDQEAEPAADGTDESPRLMFSSADARLSVLPTKESTFSKEGVMQL